MRRLFVQLCVIISVSSILAGCPAKEGAEPVAEAELFFVDPLPLGIPVFTEIDEPFFATATDDPKNSLSLLSFTLPEAGEIADGPVRIFNNCNRANATGCLSSGQLLSLNTVDDDISRAEVSIIVRADTVYKVDHINNEIRLLNHFVNKVCEIIPAEIVATESLNNATTVNHTVLHDEMVYVMTAEGDGSNDDCADPDNVKRFYRLPLNFQFNADNSDNTSTNELRVVSESLARAQLVFGWVDDEVTTASSTDQRLTYGYLGYSLSEQLLRFYDETRTERWSQARTVQIFDVTPLVNEGYSPEYLFKLTSLEKQQYMLQSGLDVFVFDSSQELFSKAFDETDTVLTDRVFKADSNSASSAFGAEIIEPVTVLSDDDEVIFIDNSKIYRYNYLSFYQEPVATRNFSIKKQNPVAIDRVEYRAVQPFSQFDIGDCNKQADATECAVAHNPALDSWQFISDCTADLSCDLNVDITDFCATAAELQVDPTAGILCTASDYRHLNELNQVANDAEFRGYMQYDKEYVRNLDYILDDNSLYITARMIEKEILLRYFYNVDLSGSKADRESIIFGERVEHAGLDAYLNDHNLYVTSLLATDERSGECYKNYQRVQCRLGEFIENGGGLACTGRDLLEETCTTTFLEYESRALFCNAAQINNGSCNDDALIPQNTLQVELSNQNAKWLRLLDLTLSETGLDSMHLLIDDADSVVDEGVLTFPEMFSVDLSGAAPIPDRRLGSLMSSVESVVGGWISSDSVGRFDVISEEVDSSEIVAPTSIKSIADIYFMTDPKAVGQVDHAAELKFFRPITQFDE